MRKSNRKMIKPFYLISIALFSLSLFGSDTTTTAGSAHLHSIKAKTKSLKNRFLKRKWGVEVVFVRQSSAGYMLEFRYKVIDAQKAKSLFNRQTKPVLHHVNSGADLIVPTPAKTGALRNSNLPKDGKQYWMFFANPGKLVKSGDKVNITIGDFSVKDLVVI